MCVYKMHFFFLIAEVEGQAGEPRQSGWGCLYKPGAASGAGSWCFLISGPMTKGSGLAWSKAATWAARGVSLQLSLQPSETLFLDKTVSNERGNCERKIWGKAGYYLFACFLFETAVPCVAGAAHSLPGLSSHPVGP